MNDQPTQIRKSHPFGETVRRTAAKVVRDSGLGTTSRSLVHPANISMINGASSGSNPEGTPNLVASVEGYGPTLDVKDVSRSRLAGAGGVALEDDGTAIVISGFGLFDWGYWLN